MTAPRIVFGRSTRRLKARRAASTAARRSTAAARVDTVAARASTAAARASTAAASTARRARARQTASVTAATAARRTSVATTRPRRKRRDKLYLNMSYQYVVRHRQRYLVWSYMSDIDNSRCESEFYQKTDDIIVNTVSFSIYLSNLTKLMTLLQYGWYCFWENILESKAACAKELLKPHCKNFPM